MGKSWVFCLASTVEGFGLVTVEALAVGTPFVNSNIAVTNEITEGGKGGLLFELNNSGDLAKKLVKLIKDRRLYEKKREEGISLASKYEWREIAGQTLNVYRRAVASISGKIGL